MLKKDPNYTRLKKLGGRANTGSAYYWLGLDHLLVVEVSSYNERYRRFYFRDIQAVVVQRNRHRMWGNLVAAALATIPVGGAIALISDGEFGGAVVFAVVLILVAIGALVNSLRGPTCSVHLRTAVQSQKLTGIVRWPKADHFIETVAPLIQSAQSTTVETPAATAAPASTPPADSTAQPGIL